METLAKLNRLLVILMVVGFSLVVAGCGDDNPSKPDDPPIETQSISILLDKTVSLNANTSCSTGRDFCVEDSFIPLEVGKVVTISAASPSNLDPDVTLLNSAGTYVAGGYTLNPGSEILTFTPAQINVYRVIIYDYQRVGGSVRILITQ